MIVSSNKTQRLIYFRGHPDIKNSVLITQVCDDYSTIPTMDLECATRTLLNLYNLQTVRGLVKNGELDSNSSMSGPHNYYGFIDPLSYHTIKFSNDTPNFYRHNKPKKLERAPKLSVDEKYILNLENYVWKIGKDLTRDDITKYNFDSVNENQSFVNVNNQHFVDSLFPYPGILELEQDTLNMLVIEDAYNYDLTSFNVQLVKNDEPFSFDREQVKNNIHAQHKLRLITYNYGVNYLKDYLMKSNGVFIERHGFIQLITPNDISCSGFVLLGRETIDNSLQLIAISIPYGYTLLIDSYAIHGDSGLIGTYTMAMTGNHVAMATADTVYIKNKYTSNNVYIENNISSNCEKIKRKLLLTSNNMSLIKLHRINSKIIDKISRDNSYFFEPVIYTPSNSLGWIKTVGKYLPSI